MSLSPLVNAVDLEAQGVTLDRQRPAGAVLGHVEVDGYQLATTTIAAGGTDADGLPRPERGVALLIPGFTSNMDTFAMLLAPLAERGFRVVSFSQRGQALSEGPDETQGYSLERLGADVHALADALELGDRVHLLGHSFGGVVAQEAVLQRPERFASFTSWNSGPRSMGEVLDAPLAALRDHGPRGLWVLDRLKAGADPDVDLRGELNPVEDYYYRRLMSTNPAQLEAGLQILRNQADRVDDLAATGLPTLVSHGARDDAWPIDWQREMAERLGAEYWVLAGAGHSAQADRSWASASLLGTFWAQHSA
jgi:pimeloyl-ACP methyl ester carboxylesterase